MEKNKEDDMDPIIFIDQKSKKIFNSNIPLFKISSIERSLKELTAHPIWFSNPSIWRDPYEHFFYNSQYNGSSYGLHNRVFVSCFSPIRVVEPQWTTYTNGEPSLCFEYNKEQLLQTLNEYCINNHCKAYIGCVKYMQTNTILRLHPKDYCKRQAYNSFMDKDWVKLLFIKRNAFVYENELRIALVFENSSEKDGIDINCQSSIIQSITLDPRLQEVASSLLTDVLVNKYGFHPFKNKLHKTHHIVRASRLYKLLSPKSFK